jgi:N-acetylneuraminic acid mutarotase
MLPPSVSKTDELFICLECTIKAIPSKDQSLECIEESIRSKLLSFYSAKQNQIFETNKQVEAMHNKISQSYQSSLKVIELIKEELLEIEKGLRAKYDFFIDSLEKSATTLQEEMKQRFCVVKQNIDVVCNVKTGIARSMQQLVPLKKITTDDILDIEKNSRTLSVTVVFEEFNALFSNIKSLILPAEKKHVVNSPKNHERTDSLGRYSSGNSKSKDLVNLLSMRKTAASKQSVGRVTGTLGRNSHGKGLQASKYPDKSFEKKYKVLKRPKENASPKPFARLESKVRSIKQEERHELHSRNKRSPDNLVKKALVFDARLNKHDLELLSSIRDTDYFENTDKKTRSPTHQTDTRNTNTANGIHREFSPTFQNMGNFVFQDTPVYFRDSLFDRVESKGQLLTGARSSSFLLRERDTQPVRPYKYIFMGNNGRNRSFKYETYDSNLNYEKLKSIPAFDENPFLKWAVKVFDEKSQKLYMLGGVNEENSVSSIPIISNKMYAYDFKTNTLEELKDLVLAYEMTNFAALFHDGHIYITGGLTHDITLRGCLDISITDRKITSKRAMTDARSHHSMVMFDGKLVCMGGYDEGRWLTLSSVESYDFKKNTWSQLSYLHHARKSHSSIVFKGFIYVFGGHDGQNYLNSVERYDWTTDTWTVMKPMSEPKALVGLQLTQEADGVIICGGFNGSKINAIEEYYDEHKHHLSKNEKKLIEKKFEVICLRLYNDD